MQLINTKELNAALKRILRTTQAIQSRVQAFAEQAIAHSIVHGDISVGVNLLEAISVNKALRKVSLIAYLEKFGNFAVDIKTKKLTFRPSYKIGEISAEHEALFLSVKWDDAKKEETITSIYDMEDIFRRFIVKQHKLASEAAKVDSKNTVEHVEVLTAIEQAFNKWSALNALRSMKVDEAVIAATADSEKVFAARADALAAEVEVEAEAKRVADLAAADAWEVANTVTA